VIIGRICSVAVLAWLLAACAISETSVPRTGGPAAPAPAAKQGAYWEYAVRDGYTGMPRGTYRYTVSHVDADRVVARLVYGVGTGLITSRGQAALDGVYKLVALRKDNAWLPVLKVSESSEKTLNPGHKVAWRLYDQRGRATTDLLTLADEDPNSMFPIVLHHPVQHTRYRTLERQDVSRVERLHAAVLDGGQTVYTQPSIDDMRACREDDLGHLDPGVKRLMNPHIYHVSVSQRLWALKQELIGAARPNSPA